MYKILLAHPKQLEIKIYVDLKHQYFSPLLERGEKYWILDFPTIWGQEKGGKKLRCENSGCISETAWV